MQLFRHPRILAAVSIVVLAVIALPVLAPQTLPGEPTPQPPAANPTLPPQATEQAVQTSPTEAATALPTRSGDELSALRLGVGESTSCSLTGADGTNTLAPGADCQEVTARLRIPTDGTLWLNLTLTDQPDLWLHLDAVAGDATPPELDQRGRYFGCSQAQEAAQMCQVTVEVGEKAYRVAVPLQAEANATSGST